MENTLINKETFTDGDWNRAFAPFYDNKIKETFKEVFTNHPPKDLVKLDNKNLAKLLLELSQQPNVIECQDIFEPEKIYGESILPEVRNILFVQMQSLGIIPIDKDIYDKTYQEVWVQKKNREIIATAQFHSPEKSEEKLNFKPEHLFYADLFSLFDKNEPIWQKEGSEFIIRKVADIHVFRDNVDDQILENRVKNVLKNSHYKLKWGSKKNRKYLEKIVIDEGLFQIFKTLKTQDKINYTKVYKIFEAIRRENINLDQFNNIDTYIRKVLQDEIDKEIPLPYVIFRERSKRKDKEFTKALLSLYNIRNEGDKDKLYLDKNGIRVILSSENKVYRLNNLVLGYPNWKVLEQQKKNYMNKPKDNGYRSIHIPIGYKNIIFELQIRTHHADKEEKTNPNQSHSLYSEKNRKSLERIPIQVLGIGAELFGITNYAKFVNNGKI